MTFQFTLIGNADEIFISSGQNSYIFKNFEDKTFHLIDYLLTNVIIPNVL